MLHQFMQKVISVVSVPILLFWAPPIPLPGGGPAEMSQTAPYQHCLQNHSGDDRDKFIREIHFYILAANPY